MSELSRRRHPARRRGPSRRVLTLVLGVLLAVGLWAAWSGWTVYRDLRDARAAATGLQAALEDQDGKAAQAALADLQTSSTSAAEGADGLVWALASRLPLVGNDADAVRLMSRALSDVAGEGLSPLVQALRDLERGRFDPRNGRLPLDQVEALGPGLERSQASFDRARELLEQVPTDLALSQVRDAEERLSSAVDDGLARLRPARRAVRLLPPMLGSDGERTYLLVLQNNAEIRSTGGFPGSTFLLSAEDGKIDLGESVAGNTFEFLEPPGLPLSPEERTLFTDRAATRFVDANFIPDFSRAAELWRARYEERFDVRVDGVLSTDPVALSYLLDGQEPIQVQGVTLTSDNVVQELLSTTYARLVDPAEQDAFFKAAGGLIFDRLLTDPDPRQLIDGLRRGLDEGRVRIVSADEQEQALLDDGGLSGSIADGGPATMGVYVNDTTATTGSKLSYYLQYDASLAPARCADREITLDGALVLRSTINGDPAGLPEYVRAGSDPVGTEDLTLFLLGPRGGDLGRVRVDGQDVEAVAGSYEGRPGLRVELALPAGGQRRLTWQVTARGVDGSGVVLATTPSVQPRPSVVTVPTSCS